MADCSFCGLCEETCPWNAISIAENVVTNYARCMRCFRCIKVCPSNERKVIDLNFPKFVEKFEEMMKDNNCRPEMFFME